MDNNSPPGEIMRMVRFAMKHANYQGSMTGETITETMVHMMNKQVAAFLYYFLKDAALPVDNDCYHHC